MTKILWRSCFAAGAVAYVYFGYMVARVPMVRRLFWVYLILGALLALALVLFAMRERRMPRLRSSGKAKAWGLMAVALIAGMAFSWGLVTLGGQWRYRQTLEWIRDQGYEVAKPTSDMVDESDSNGMTVLSELKDAKWFRTLMDGEKKPKKPGVSQLYDEGFKKYLGKEQDADAFENLKAKRQAWQPALRLLEKAQLAPRFSWNINRDMPLFKIEIPSMVHYLELARVVSAEASVLIEQGRFKDAEARLGQINWMIDRLVQDPTVIAMMIASALDRIKLKTAIPLFARGRGDSLLRGRQPGQLEQRLKEVLALELQLAPKAMMELSLGDIARDHQLGSGRGEFNIPEFFFTVAHSPWMAWDVSAGLRGGARQVSCFNMETTRDQLSCFDATLDEIETNGWLLQSIATPRWDVMLVRGVHSTALRRMAQLAVSAAEFRTKSGAWPKSLTELGLAGQVKNPFTHEPFEMKNRGDTLILRGRGSGAVLENVSTVPDWEMHLVR